jgi:primosomal protein N' (replication factor Y)
MRIAAGFANKARMRTVHILLPTNLPRGFDYAVPEGMALAVGDLVAVTLARKPMLGVVWGEGTGEVPLAKLKQVEAKLDTIPPFSEELRKFLSWVADYTLSPLGAVLKMALPVPKAFTEKTRNQRPETKDQGKGIRLSSLQEQALVDMQAAGAKPVVLEGITGSGKTEVYFSRIHALLAQDPAAQILVMLPEIALTHQWLSRFEAAFGFAPVLWHSEVGVAARKRAFLAIARGEARVIVGARSALFLPYPNLAAIIVDEEHEASYKQEDGVTYQARDMAVVRGAIEKIPVVLVSATPSLETLSNIGRGKYAHVKLTERFGGAKLPEVTLLDLRADAPERGEFLAPTLKMALRETLARGEQSLLFLNRRGYAPLLLCRHCGHRFECKECSAWLVLHKRVVRHQASGVSERPAGNLACHHCGHREPEPTACPACGETEHLAACGPGVERVVEEVRAMLPEARISLLSSDEGGLADEIDAILAGGRDIIIGTQMVAKGHHFPKLTTVGIIDADMGLNGGDVRAGERSFQLLHQLGGRAGRESAEGRVYVQTYQPEHPVMQALASGDGEAFLALEREGRQHAGWPPYGQLASLLFDGPRENEVRGAAQHIARMAPRDKRVRVLGPAPAALSRLKGQYRYRLIVKANREVHLQQMITEWLEGIALPRQVRLKVDVNPYSFV